MSIIETTSSKLQETLDTKQAIREAILAKGGTLETDVFATYPAAILNLPGTRPPIQRSYYFGYDWNTVDQNPATCISYPEDVDNAEYAKAVMNFGASFDYGGWPSTPGSTFMPKPCMLNFDGTVDYYLNPNDYGTKEEGGASDIANTSYSGNAMMEWPKIYTKRWQDGDVYHFRCSDAKLDSEYECWCNYDANDQEIDHFYTAIYNGWVDSSEKLRSLSGQKTSLNSSWADMFTKARANGPSIYAMELLCDLKLIQDLLIMMFKSTDLSNTAGVGATNTSSGTPLVTGTLNAKGLFWGSNAKGVGVKVFGMEYYWGDMYRHIAGYVAVGRSQYVKITRGTKDGSTVTDYNDTGTGYIKLEGSNFISATANNGYIKKLHTYPHGRYAVELIGSATTYVPDLVAVPSVSSTGGTVAKIGGTGAHKIADLGPFFMQANVKPEQEQTLTTTLLSCKPLAPTST